MGIGHYHSQEFQNEKGRESKVPGNDHTSHKCHGQLTCKHRCFKLSLVSCHCLDNWQNATCILRSMRVFLQRETITVKSCICSETKFFSDWQELKLIFTWKFATNQNTTMVITVIMMSRTMMIIFLSRCKVGFWRWHWSRMIENTIEPYCLPKNTSNLHILFGTPAVEPWAVLLTWCSTQWRHILTGCCDLLQHVIRCVSVCCWTDWLTAEWRVCYAVCQSLRSVAGDRLATSVNWFCLAVLCASLHINSSWSSSRPVSWLSHLCYDHVSIL